MHLLDYIHGRNYSPPQGADDTVPSVVHDQIGGGQLPLADVGRGHTLWLLMSPNQRIWCTTRMTRDSLSGPTPYDSPLQTPAEPLLSNAACRGSVTLPACCRPHPTDPFVEKAADADQGATSETTPDCEPVASPPEYRGVG